MSTPRRAADPAPTQLRHPWRTTVRTLAWYAVALLGAAALGGPVIAEQLGGYLGPRVVEALVWFAGLSAALLALVQRLALLAPVAAILARVGLGTGKEPQPEADDLTDSQED